jgi:hypothetical protein
MHHPHYPNSSAGPTWAWIQHKSMLPHWNGQSRMHSICMLSLRHDNIVWELLFGIVADTDNSYNTNLRDSDTTLSELSRSTSVSSKHYNTFIHLCCWTSGNIKMMSSSTTCLPPWVHFWLLVWVTLNCGITNLGGVCLDFLTASGPLKHEAQTNSQHLNQAFAPQKATESCLYMWSSEGSEYELS